MGWLPFLCNFQIPSFMPFQLFLLLIILSFKIPQLGLFLIMTHSPLDVDANFPSILHKKTYFFYFTHLILQNTHISLSILHIYLIKYSFFYYFLLFSSLIFFTASLSISDPTTIIITTACSLPSAGDRSNIILGASRLNHKEQGKFKNYIIK